ncbi:C40 family peptidase [Bordetella avium]|uniref:Lipoprotein n=1 Tax=Bordetella avium (strain 197N) TaxID=360910 RepID=Q2KY39_BORA1|nr:C40 family peptidase [Bordetella avium]AZY48638.1 peptidoglycan endopeptidase [Bordetella avium]RIQ13945.1 peptidoglycan endopeptidase [Bordetella avium]RIQ39642.1 peptidoglycan endopeptidase [Bordetella avium]RIQ44441.1 peptidoglycan endopeptidase [Bordetella avium]RIQ45340.1 peptidoglycan endopeptidase [Bordetella avium]
MHRHSYIARPSLRSARRGLRLLASVFCVAVMAGCATKSNKSANAYDSEIDPYETEWVATTEDPIGLLVTHKLKRERQRQVQAPFRSESALVAEALNQLGVRYRFGGTSPDTGFDCSGLIAYSAERSLGLKLPRNAADLARQSTVIDRKELRPGDLVFFNTLGRRYSHVGIYMGDNRFVHSPSAGGVVRVENMTIAYWSKRFNGARRLDGSLLAQASNN